MLRIVCTGDSHTWGEGVPELLQQFDPPVVGGELRPVDWQSDGYVNQLRRLVETRTGASSREWTARQLAALADVPYLAPCAQLTKPLTLPVRGELLRLVLGCRAEPCDWRLTVDGESVSGTLPGETGDKAYRLVWHHMAPGEHLVTLSGVREALPVYRIECYDGAAAVLNVGVGSCPTYRYLEEYFPAYVAAAKPDVILAEAHTINDWLDGAPPAVYAQRLEALLRTMKGTGAQVFLLTVSPILGNQLAGAGVLYDAYVQASRAAAAAAEVPVCDANRVMQLMLEGMDEQAAAAYLYGDPWHPGRRGHGLYALLLEQTLEAAGIL